MKLLEDIISADCVWITVDMSDPRWANRFTEATGRPPNVDRYSTVAGELQSSVASCYKYMPWHKGRKIVVTDDQDFYEEDFGGVIEVVDVREYLPEKYYPTFNSDPLQLYQDLIPDLSETFISWDDDIFLTADIEPSRFQAADKLACYGFPLPPASMEKGTWGRMQSTLFKANPEWRFFNAHMPHILSQSACRDAREKFPDLIHAACWDDVRGKNWLGGTEAIHSLASEHFTQVINDGRGYRMTEYLGYHDLMKNEYKRKTDRPFLCINNFAGQSPKKYEEFLNLL